MPATPITMSERVNLAAVWIKAKLPPSVLKTAAKISEYVSTRKLYVLGWIGAAVVAGVVFPYKAVAVGSVLVVAAAVEGVLYRRWKPNDVVFREIARAMRTSRTEHALQTNITALIETASNNKMEAKQALLSLLLWDVSTHHERDGDAANKWLNALANAHQITLLSNPDSQSANPLPRIDMPRRLTRTTTTAPTPTAYIQQYQHYFELDEQPSLEEVTNSVEKVQPNEVVEIIPELCSTMLNTPETLVILAHLLEQQSLETVPLSVLVQEMRAVSFALSALSRPLSDNTFLIDSIGYKNNNNAVFLHRARLAAKLELLMNAAIDKKKMRLDQVLLTFAWTKSKAFSQSLHETLSRIAQARNTTLPIDLQKLADEMNERNERNRKETEKRKEREARMEAHLAKSNEKT